MAAHKSFIFSPRYSLSSGVSSGYGRPLCFLQDEVRTGRCHNFNQESKSSKLQAQVFFAATCRRDSEEKEMLHLLRATIFFIIDGEDKNRSPFSFN